MMIFLLFIISNQIDELCPPWCSPARARKLLKLDNSSYNYILSTFSLEELNQIINSAKPDTDPIMLFTLYKGLSRSRLEYGAFVW